jgi:hypothetical protein
MAQIFGHIRDYFADVFGQSEEDQKFAELLSVFDKVQEKREKFYGGVEEKVTQPLYNALDPFVPTELMQMSSDRSSIPQTAPLPALPGLYGMQSTLADAGISNQAASALQSAPAFTPSSQRVINRGNSPFNPVAPVDVRIQTMQELINGNRGALEDEREAQARAAGVLSTTNPLTMGY